MIDRPEELERALRDSWTADHLRAYGEHLQSIGDPRGELISLDLAPEPDSESWLARRKALLERWLGPTLAARVGHRVQHGFVHELRDSKDTMQLLDGPLGAVVRGFTTWSGACPKDPRDVLHALEHLARAPRPWLTRLTVASYDNERASPTLCAALIEATPNLELCITGQQRFESFHHPALRKLYVTVTFGTPVLDSHVPITDTLDDIFYGDHLVADDGDLTTLLEAIDTTSDCNQLFAEYASLVGRHDSLPALLLRFHYAGLVRLAGPVVHLTAAGRGLLRSPDAHDRAEPPMPNARHSKYVLHIAKTKQDLVEIGLMMWQCEVLHTCLERMPIDDGTHDAICGYLGFLRDLHSQVEDDHRWETYRSFEGDVIALTRALDTLLTFHKLHAVHGMGLFNDFNDVDHAWTGIESLNRLLKDQHAKGMVPLFRLSSKT